MHTHARMHTHWAVRPPDLISFCEAGTGTNPSRWSFQSETAIQCVLPLSSVKHTNPSERPTVRPDPLNPAEQCITSQLTFTCTSKNQIWKVHSHTNTFLLMLVTKQFWWPLTHKKHWDISQNIVLKIFGWTVPLIIQRSMKHLQYFC